nr:hypothetical protein [Tanacetum cinerariifolium]
MTEEVFQAKVNLMKSIQTFLEKFNCIPFGENPKVLLQACENFFAIQHAQPEDTNELFQKILEDLQIINEELVEYINYPSQNRPTFYKDDEEHSVQYKEYLENSSNAIAATNFNQEKEAPPENFDIRQLIREECGIKFCEEQKKNMEDMMLDCLKFVDKKSFIEVKDIVEQPTKSGTQPEYSFRMGYEHLNTILETKSDKIIKSSVEKLVPIPSEYEVTSDNESECDVPVCKDSSIFDVLKDHYEILSDSNTDDTSSDDDAFEDIEYVEASLPDSELVSLEEENDVYQEEEDPTPDHVLKSSSSSPIFEKSDKSLSYSDKSLPEFETFSDYTEETRSEVDLFLALDNSIPLGIENFDYDSEGDIHFLKELLRDDSIPLPENESSNFDHHNDPLFPLPPPEPPDVEVFFDFEPNLRELISVVINNIDELNEDECFDPGGEIDVF